MSLTDSAAPWNEGSYRIEVAAGQTNVERVNADGDIALSTTVLAPIFNGYLSIASAGLGGLVDIKNEAAVADAKTFFATHYRPFCADMF
jgi:hypothetical protein